MIITNFRDELLESKILTRYHAFTGKQEHIVHLYSKMALCFFPEKRESEITALILNGITDLLPVSDVLYLKEKYDIPVIPLISIQRYGSDVMQELYENGVRTAVLVEPGKDTAGDIVELILHGRSDTLAKVTYGIRNE
mgnify:CR=1 FL=1